MITRTKFRTNDVVVIRIPGDPFDGLRAIVTKVNPMPGSISKLEHYRIFIVQHKETSYALASELEPISK